MNDSIRKKINEMRYDEWWKSDGEESYVKYAEELTQKGFTEDEAIDFLSGCFWTAAEEFGGG